MLQLEHPEFMASWPLAFGTVRAEASLKRSILAWHRCDALHMLGSQGISLEV